MKKLNIKDMVEKLLLWLAIAIIGGIMIKAERINAGSNDGSKAYRMALEQQKQIDSLCVNYIVQDVHLKRAISDIQEIKEATEFIKNYILTQK
jgi:hypothetical protein